MGDRHADRLGGAPVRSDFGGRHIGVQRIRAIRGPIDQTLIHAAVFVIRPERAPKTDIGGHRSLLHPDTTEAAQCLRVNGGRPRAHVCPGSTRVVREVAVNARQLDGIVVLGGARGAKVVLDETALEIQRQLRSRRRSALGEDLHHAVDGVGSVDRRGLWPGENFDPLDTHGIDQPQVRRIGELHAVHIGFDRLHERAGKGRRAARGHEDLSGLESSRPLLLRPETGNITMKELIEMRNASLFQFLRGDHGNGIGHRFQCCRHDRSCHDYLIERDGARFQGELHGRSVIVRDRNNLLLPRISDAPNRQPMCPGGGRRDRECPVYSCLEVAGVLIERDGDVRNRTFGHRVDDGSGNDPAHRGNGGRGADDPELGRPIGDDLE